MWKVWKLGSHIVDFCSFTKQFHSIRMENRKHIQVLGYIALYFFPKYQNDDVTGGGGGEKLLEKCQDCPWWGRDLVYLNLELFKTGVLGRPKPTRFPRNPLHEICALGHKTGVGVGWRDWHARIFVVYSWGTWQNCLACGVLKRSRDGARVNVWAC